MRVVLGGDTTSELAMARPALMAVPGGPRPTGTDTLPGSPYPKAELLPRVLARLFDLMVCGGMIALSRQAGAIVGAVYLLIADALFRGQSPGKKLLGLKVIHLPTQRPVGARLSAVRNYPMALVGLLALDAPEGWVAMLVGSALVLGYETYRVVHDPLGIRQGDQLARTQVVDAKVVAGQAVFSGVGQGSVEAAGTRFRRRWHLRRRWLTIRSHSRQ